MLAPASQRRNLIIALGFLIIVGILLHSGPSVNTERFKAVIPGHGSATSDEKATDAKPTDGSAPTDVEAEYTPAVEAQDTDPEDAETEAAETEGDGSEDDGSEGAKAPAPADADTEPKPTTEAANPPQPTTQQHLEEVETSDPQQPVPENTKAAEVLPNTEAATEKPVPTTNVADPEGEGQTASIQPEATREPKPEDDTDSDGAGSGDAGSDVAIKTSQFHYLIPASKANRRFCFILASSAASRYPPPQLMGWNGTGLFDAAKTHLAKLRAIQVYLDSLPEEEDDDIVLIVDGYDVIMQLPPEIMLKRYFQTRDAENKRTAERFGISLEQVKEQNLDTTLFFGPDKICWPINWRAPRCWAVPPSTLPSKAFGPKTNNGNMIYMLPKWLNSGTLIGPANHMRDYVAATMKEIDHTFDPTYQWKDSDQYYLANVWGRQEYFRSKKLHGNDDVPGGPKDRFLPRKFTNNQQVEFHVGIEYESAMFQTKAGYEPFNGWIHYNGTDTPTAMMTKDMFDEGDAFKPFPIEMPKEIENSLSKIYDEIPEAHPGSTSKDWIRDVVLGTNFVTKNIWGLWHVTGDKNVIESQYTKFWFYPFARSLLKSAVTTLQASHKISEEPIGGRYWVHKTVYPDSDQLADPLGGAWSDEETGHRFVPYNEMCKDFEKDVLGGEKSESKKPDTTSD